MRIKQSTSVLAGCAALSIFSADMALAHAHLVRATPAVGSTVPRAPSEVVLHFSEKLENVFSSVVVRDSGGNPIDKGDAHVDDADRAMMKTSLPPLAPGVYKVEWKALSTDTHKSDGDFTFKVGK